MLDALAWYEAPTGCWQRQVELLVPCGVRRNSVLRSSHFGGHTSSSPVLDTLIYGGRPKQLFSIHLFTDVKIEGGSIHRPLNIPHGTEGVSVVDAHVRADGFE